MKQKFIKQPFILEESFPTSGSDRNVPIAEEALFSVRTTHFLQNLQKPTKRRKYSARTPYDRLDDIHKLATEMRARWMPYNKLVEAIKKVYQKEYKEQSIREWFAEDGSCKEALDWLKNKRSKEKQADLVFADQKLKDSAVDAIGLLLDLMLYDSEELKLTDRQIQQARDFLDRAGFPKANKTDLSGKIESESMTELSGSIRAILERK